MQLTFSYWIWLGTIYLIILTYQDIKHNKLVDERKNYFMFGSTFALLSHFSRPLWIILVFFAIIYTLSYYLNKTKLVGEADVQTLAWIFYGFAIIQPYYLVLFGGLFLLNTLVYLLARKYFYKIQEATPFYAVILFSFVVTSLWLKLY